MESLINAFKKAGLVLKVLIDPIRTGRGMENIVQIDIQRSRRNYALREEWFRIYPGKETTLQVRGTDKKRRQLVLLVKEGEQEFHEELSIRSVQRKKGWLPEFLTEHNLTNRDVVELKKATIVLRRFTPKATRYFLMGVDERQLFIAQLTGPATTVEEARRLLGKSIQLAEGQRRGSSIDRQGEYFFLETTREQRETLEELLKVNKVVIQPKQSIGKFMGRQGNPHTADELIHISDQFNALGSEKGQVPVRQRKVFIRGKVRHKDHKTVSFSQWREVVRNNEVSGALGSNGVMWTD